MPRRTRNIGHRHNGLVLLVAVLLFKTHSAHPASQLCLLAPCHFPPMALQSIDQLPTSGEEIDNWGYRIQNRQNKQLQNDRVSDFRAFPQEVFEKNSEWGQDYEGLPAILERSGGVYDEGLPSRSLILLLLRSQACDPTVSKCQTAPTKKELSSEGYNQPMVKEYRLPDKRSRQVTQRWSTAGLPFSVLYHKQVRTKSGYGNTGVSGGESQNVAPAPQRATDSWSSHGMTTRRQYSTLPHLFVSYGWGPLGK